MPQRLITSELISWIALGGVVLVAILMVWLTSASRRHWRLFRQLIRRADGANLEKVLESLINDQDQVNQRLAQLDQRADALGRTVQGCYQHVGFVRFDAFEEVGGAQSFAIALLDSNNNGLVLSSVYGRSDVRVYAKAIQQGRPSHILTQEEKQAISQAMGK
ncbi:MAG: DUF4446 family protein [Armatimonadetes bacterium]|nr:DUF4446 family protein [Armatimonadota bacterium]